MLYEFIQANHDELVTMAQGLIGERTTPRALAHELEEGVPLFLDQLAESIRMWGKPSPEQETSWREGAERHGGSLLKRGFTVAQVVHDYGAICQSVTNLAVEREEPIAADEFRALNLHLDDAIADAVTGYVRAREDAWAEDERQRLASFAHEMRNLVGTAMLSFELVRSGKVPTDGSSARIHQRTLHSIQLLIDRTLSEVRLGASLVHPERIRLAELLEEIEITAAADARNRHREFVVSPVAWELVVQADRQLLASALSNVLQNALKFTRTEGRVLLRTGLAPGRTDLLWIEVEDQCGGLPDGKLEEMFLPFRRGEADHSGLGMGLSISRRAVEACGGSLTARDLPGHGCVFTIELPLASS